MRIEPWGYGMNDLGYNWSFKINLQDLKEFIQSHGEEYNPLGGDNGFVEALLAKNK